MIRYLACCTNICPDCLPAFHFEQLRCTNLCWHTWWLHLHINCLRNFPHNLCLFCAQKIILFHPYARFSTFLHTFRWDWHRYLDCRAFDHSPRDLDNNGSPNYKYISPHRFSSHSSITHHTPVLNSASIVYITVLYHGVGHFRIPHDTRASCRHNNICHTHEIPLANWNLLHMHLRSRDSQSWQMNWGVSYSK